MLAPGGLRLKFSGGSKIPGGIPYIGSHHKSNEAFVFEPVQRKQKAEPEGFDRMRCEKACSKKMGPRKLLKSLHTGFRGAGSPESES